ncbi:hypothetical protein H6P81_007948 [Aristolochia fimbriata]|uniref:ribonuclease P n=1 Tax=Aristolochia fimbriata TaxID=158543 RepID=A0AAV7F2U8_ARIFI|nr:hypothetical protein H6P81_007948 [Aristolochia fimbriata]
MAGESEEMGGDMEVPERDGDLDLQCGPDRVAENEMDAARALADLARLTVAVTADDSVKSAIGRRRSRRRFKDDEEAENLRQIQASDPPHSQSCSWKNQYRQQNSCKYLELEPVEAPKDKGAPKSGPSCSVNHALSNRGKTKQNLTEAEKETRKLRRILANRESARQTIRRRQALCEELANKASDLACDNESLTREKELIMKEYLSLKDTNNILKAQIQKTLKEEDDHTFETVSNSEEKQKNSASFGQLSTLKYNNKMPDPPYFWPWVCPVQMHFASHSSSESKNSKPNHEFLDLNRVSGPGIPLCLVPYPWFYPVGNCTFRPVDVCRSREADEDSEDEKHGAGMVEIPTFSVKPYMESSCKEVLEEEESTDHNIREAQVGPYKDMSHMSTPSRSLSPNLSVKHIPPSNMDFLEAGHLPLEPPGVPVDVEDAVAQEIAEDGREGLPLGVILEPGLENILHVLRVRRDRVPQYVDVDRPRRGLPQQEKLSLVTSYSKSEVASAMRSSPLLYERVPVKNTLWRGFLLLQLLLLLSLLLYRLLGLLQGTKLGSPAWLLAFLCESWFTFVLLLTMNAKWNPVEYRTYPQRLLKQFPELPRLDLFVTTADPTLEPPIVTVNTVLSLLAVDYPAHKLACYVSDDGASAVTFYSLLQAFEFGKSWVPFCKKYNLRLRAPAAYFSAEPPLLVQPSDHQGNSSHFLDEWREMKEGYVALCRKIEKAAEGNLDVDLHRNKDYAVFSNIERGNHPSIIKVIWENKEEHPAAIPHLVYVAREKRPKWPHHYKAGAMNVLTRVSGVMTNAPFILNVDCDMHANNPQVILHAMCLLLGDRSEKENAFAQCPQYFYGALKDDPFGNHFVVGQKVIVHGIAGLQGPIYGGTGCVHRRKIIYGQPPQAAATNDVVEDVQSKVGHSKQFAATVARILSLRAGDDQGTNTTPRDISSNIEAALEVSSCSYEINTSWGDEIGWVYGSATEDVLTGLKIHSMGWRSTYLTPDPPAFLGCAPPGGPASLVQMKRWTTGMLEIFFTRYNPLLATLTKKLQFRQSLCYFSFIIWAPRSVPEMCYSLLPAYCLLSNNPFLPKITEPGAVIPASLFAVNQLYGASEFICCRQSIRAWWNTQRMSRIVSSTSGLFGILSVFLKLLGVSETLFESMGSTEHHSQNRRKKKKAFTPEGEFRFKLETCSKKNDLSQALSLYENALSQNLSLNISLINTLLYLCSNSLSSPLSDSREPSTDQSAIEKGFEIYNHMLDHNMSPTEATITAVARLAAAKEDGDFAFKLVKDLEKYKILPRLRTYGPALLTFCRKLEADMAYSVEEDMTAKGVVLEEPEISALLKVSVDTDKHDKVYLYLQKLRSSVKCVSGSTGEIIESWFRGKLASEVSTLDWDVNKVKEVVSMNGGGWHGLGWLGKGAWEVCKSQIQPDGRCLTCCQDLVPVDIDHVETEKFAESIASLAAQREARANFSQFQKWLENHPGYEAIVDGANVGFFQQNFIGGGFSVSQIESVVRELCRRGEKKWPLVILHNQRVEALMKTPSSRELLEEWQAQGALYTTPKGSNDDWYWIYAAVKNKCLMVTNDEMRDHIFELLGQDFFLRWKERHHVHYTFAKGDVILKMPPLYSTVIQESATGSWHFPLAGEFSDEALRTWLCINRKQAPSTCVAREVDEIACCDKVDSSAISGKRKR